MAREKQPPEKADDIPSWFMTYSDVITLLMTFFILLLTFATNEPERFEQLQISLFEGAGATGVAGDRPDGLERDSFVMRARPRSSRMTMRGSEMPATLTDPSYSATKEKLTGLRDDQERQTATRNYFDMPLAQIVSSRNQSVSAQGRQHFRMLAKHLRKSPFHATLSVSRADELPLALLVFNHFVRIEGIAPGKVGLSQGGAPGLKPRSLRFELTRQTGSAIR